MQNDFQKVFYMLRTKLFNITTSINSNKFIIWNHLTFISGLNDLIDNVY